MRVSVWTDGSSTYHKTAEALGHAPVGYAAIIDIEDTWRWILSAYEPDGTNNTAELSAPIMALKALDPESCKGSTLIHSDSQYVIHQAQGHWRVNKNAKLVRELQRLSRSYGAVWKHVRGHQGIELNELADQEAGAAKEFGGTERALVEAKLVYLPDNKIYLDHRNNITDETVIPGDTPWRLRLSLSALSASR